MKAWPSSEGNSNSISEFSSTPASDIGLEFPPGVVPFVRVLPWVIALPAATYEADFRGAFFGIALKKVVARIVPGSPLTGVGASGS